MTEAASPKKTNWAIVWSAIAAVAAIGALIFAGLSYFQPSPYKLEARGEYTYLRLPNNLITSLLTIGTYQHHFFFTLQNKGNKEVSNIKLMFPGGGLYEVLRKDPKANTEKFNNEIPIGNLSPTDEVTVLVWTDNEHARDIKDRMRFVHPEGVIPIQFLSDYVSPFPRWLDIAQIVATLLLALMSLVALRVTVKQTRNTVIKTTTKTEQENNQGEK